LLNNFFGIVAAMFFPVIIKKVIPTIENDRKPPRKINRCTIDLASPACPNSH